MLEYSVTLVLAVAGLVTGIFVICAFVLHKILSDKLTLIQQAVTTAFTPLQNQLLAQQKQQTEQVLGQQLTLQKLITDSLRDTLGAQADRLSQQFQQLTAQVDQKLQTMSTHVNARLNEGFEKTNQTFTDIVKRLALIDDAQKKITDLSTNVVNLQQLLNDKRSRGAFGEVQLQQLIENMLPANSYQLQFTLSTGARCDCMLFLPAPTGQVVIDAKFPLENFQRLQTPNLPDTERQQIQTRFRQDIRKHILDIQQKYIIPGETAEGALMFIPAESVFAEIHSNFPELVRLAQEKQVWLASPTTMMAILTTAQAVIKDDATRQHIKVMQTHLRLLAKDFERFEDRMGKLARHIDLAHNDVQQVHTSAKKIRSKFEKIEQVQLQEPEPEPEQELI